MKVSPCFSKSAFFYVISIAICLLSFWACSDNKKINVNDAIKAPVAIAFINANPVKLQNIKKVNVTLIDPDSMVVASGNIPFQTLEIENGVMNVGLKLKAKISNESPYRFRIKAEAEGYVPTMQTIVLEDESPKYFPVYMASIEEPPPGMSTAVSSLPVSSGGIIPSGQTISTKTGNKINQSLKITIQDSTRLLRNKEPINDVQEEAKLDISFGNPLVIEAGRTFPGGFRVSDALDSNGEIIASPSDPFYFSSAGWVTMNMKVGDQEVNGFDKPLIASMEINPELFNSNTGKLYQPGDTIPIWSQNEVGVWFEELMGVIEKNEKGTLEVNFKINHLSTWNIDNKVNPCPGDISIQVDNQLGVATLLYSELVEATNGQPYGITSIGSNGANYAYNYATGLQTVTFSRAPMGDQVAFVVYDNSSAPSPGSVLDATEVFTLCSDPTQVVTLQTNAVLPAITIRVQVDIDGLGTLRPICNNAIWYKDCPGGNCSSAGCSALFLYAGHLESDGNSGILNSAISTSQPYCMRIWYSGLDAIGNPVSQFIEFDIDFALLSAAPGTVVVSSTNANVSYVFDGGTSEYRISVDGPGEGLTDIDSCTI